MVTRAIYAMGICSGLFFVGGGGGRPAAQENSSRIFVNVVLVQLNVAVTDRRGNYVTGLKPDNFEILEDRIPEKIATFEEGGEDGKIVITADTNTKAEGGVVAAEDSPGKTRTAAKATEGGATLAEAQAGISRVAGANVFILFDTSDYMYRGFVFAQDAIAGFVRSMEESDKIALYSYSRDLLRETALTSDREAVLRGVRSTVAGDDAALYNCLLLTVKDAARLHGRKAIVVFSNGPDDASSVPPEDVEELAQSTGTIIYIISTRQAQQEPVSSAVFERLSRATGGKAYFAKNWRDERLAFGAIREDLAHLYTLSYYPKPNANPGWRKITVKLVGKDLQKFHVRTRDGYRLLQPQQQNIAATDLAAGQQ